jgi:transposase-like protein
VDGIYLKRNWGGEHENVSALVALGVNEDGYREAIGACEGMKEDKASWETFFRWLKERGLDGVRLVIGDKCIGMTDAAQEIFPESKYRRRAVHFYRNVFSATPRRCMKLAAKMLKAIHARESKEAAREKARQVAESLRAMKLQEAAKKVEGGIDETTWTSPMSIGCESGQTTSLSGSIERFAAGRGQLGHFPTATRLLCRYAPGLGILPGPSGAQRSI